MNPNEEPILIKLFGQEWPLRLTHACLARAEYTAKVKILGPQAEDFWIDLGTFQLGVLAWAGLQHTKKRWSVDDVVGAIIEIDGTEEAEQCMMAILESVKRYLEPINARLMAKEANEEPGRPFPATETTGSTAGPSLSTISE